MVKLLKNQMDVAHLKKYVNKDKIETKHLSIVYPVAPFFVVTIRTQLNLIQKKVGLYMKMTLQRHHPPLGPHCQQYLSC